MFRGKVVAQRRAGFLPTPDNENLHGVFQAEQQKHHDAESLRNIVEHKRDERRHERISRENHGARRNRSEEFFAGDKQESAEGERQGRFHKRIKADAV